MMKKILHLTLYKQWFDKIASGDKKEEYRLVKPYWIKRLRSKHYDYVHFRNGYQRQAPFMVVACEGIEEKDGCFIIHLGEVKNRVETASERVFYHVMKELANKHQLVKEARDEDTGIQ